MTPEPPPSVRRLAAEVAARYGGDLTRMRRGDGYSNATWIGGGIAVRISRVPADLTREVALTRALPRGVGHPAVLGAGSVEGHGWVVTEEVPGESLQVAWPSLAPADQRRAVEQLWGRAEALHDATPSLRTLVAPYGGFVPATVGEAVARARRAGAAGLSAAQQSRLHEVVEGYYRAAPWVEQTVNHGDLALMNALWDGEVVALLDVEYALLGPVEVDLARLVLEARVSEDGALLDAEAGDAAVEIAARRMHPVHGRDLLHGAAVLDQLRDLDLVLAQGGGGERVAQSRPFRLLTGLLGVDGGYLAPLLG